ncbi:glycosyltransferase [Candidatus Peregrinibacteria bacterium]|nr:glycosyltransferase [Candidatus Peregrinibacteria bacterium]
MKQRISALVPIYNEENLIRRCLESLKDVVDEIIIIHDGPCTDRTLEIAREYTDKIFVLERKYMADYHYIEGLNECNGDWILKIDADEYLSEEIRENIRIMTDSEIYDCYSFIWPIWDGEKYITKKWPRKDALFRKNTFSFIELPHMNFQSKGKIKATDCILHHQPEYNNYSIGIFSEKHKKWIDLHANSLMKSKIRVYNNPPEFKIKSVNIRKKYPIILVLFSVKSLLLDLIKFKFIDIRGFFAYHKYKIYYSIHLFIKLRHLNK